MGGFDAIAAKAFVRIAGAILTVFGLGALTGAISIMLYFQWKFDLPVWKMLFN